MSDGVAEGGGKRGGGEEIRTRKDDVGKRVERCGGELLGMGRD